MKKLAIIITLLSTVQLLAQQDFTIYGMHDIPQSSYSNPSNRFNGNFYLGLPAMSSNYFSFSNSGFAYSDLVKKNGDSLQLDFNNLLNTIEDDNFIAFNTKVDLLSFGISFGNRSQIVFNVTENFNFQFGYPKDFIQLMYRGNTSFGDNTANINNLGLNLTHYREYGLSYSYQLNQKLRLGLRAKYLYGMASIYNENTDITLNTDPTTYELRSTADITLRTAGLTDDGLDEMDEDISAYLFSRDNSGFGFDIGADYEFSEKLSFNASIIDIGSIKWNAYTKSYVNDGGEFSFSGVEFSAYGDDTDSLGTFDQLGDSLQDAFELDEREGSFNTPLPTRFYLGANYKVTERDMFGGLIQGSYFLNKIRPAFSINYSRKMTKWISLTTSYTMINNTYNNVGAGLNFHPGPIQFYIVSDNVLGAFQPQNSRHFHVRFGLNLLFGADKSKEIRPPYRGVTKKKDKDKTTKEEEKPIPEVVIPEEEEKDEDK